MELDDYDYELPRELIAQQPLDCRSDARLMVVDRRTARIAHFHVRDLPELLTESDSLVLNNTRVVPARLVGKRTRTGGRWEGLFLGRVGDGCWHLLGKTRGRLAAGETLTLQDRRSREGLTLELVAQYEDGSWLVRPQAAGDTWELLDRFGRVPLPPYIRRGRMLPNDTPRYQTVFAEERGAVAAPTAGLHFTRPLLAELEQRGVALVHCTLHVGLGTFRPIATERLAEHRMHAEHGTLKDEAARTLRARRAAGGRIVAVGTTVVRVLETAARLGELATWHGSTDLFIRPPYEFRAVDALLTNFHLPRSSLLVLVRTFGGDHLVRQAYQEAIRGGYRFFSYGDAMLIV